VAKAILFTGGSVFDGTAFLAPGTSVLVSGGRVTAVGTGVKMMLDRNRPGQRRIRLGRTDQARVRR
jgi:hypothetical protein